VDKIAYERIQGATIAKEKEIKEYYSEFTPYLFI
jgi:hypothetical protein